MLSGRCSRRFSIEVGGEPGREAECVRVTVVVAITRVVASITRAVILLMWSRCVIDCFDHDGGRSCDHDGGRACDHEGGRSCDHDGRRACGTRRS